MGSDCVTVIVCTFYLMVAYYHVYFCYISCYVFRLFPPDQERHLPVPVPVSFGKLRDAMGETMFYRCFKCFLGTVTFCTRHKSLSGHNCGPTNRRRKKARTSNVFTGFILNPKVAYSMHSGDCVPRTTDRLQQTMLLLRFVQVS